MNELLGLDPSLPLFHLIPLVVFGPIFALVLYHLGLKHIINPSPEVRERRRLLGEADKRAGAERTQKLRAAGLDRSGLDRSPLQWAGQAIPYSLFAISIAWLSTDPSYVANSPDKALIKLSLTHPGQRKVKCRKMSAEELQKVAVNMRSGMSCSRERWPLVADLTVDGELLYHGSARPAGLAKDGHSSFYEKFPVAAGPHRVVFRLGDRGGEGYDYVVEKEIELKAAEIMVVSFDNQTGRATVGD